MEEAKGHPWSATAPAKKRAAGDISKPDSREISDSDIDNEDGITVDDKNSMKY